MSAGSGDREGDALLMRRAGVWTWGVGSHWSCPSFAVGSR